MLPGSTSSGRSAWVSGSSLATFAAALFGQGAGTPDAAFATVAMVLAVPVAMAVHELGHALGAVVVGSASRRR